MTDDWMFNWIVSVSQEYLKKFNCVQTNDQYKKKLIELLVLYSNT